jgi:nitrate/nitrite transport system substrate-binding protein
MAAIASVLPMGAMQAMAQDKGALEKKDLKIGFIPITCASPLIMADPLGFYQKQGLNVQLMKTAGWALIRDKMINKEYDATHFLSPMPLAISMGLGSNATPMNVATIQNINGQAITLSLKHKNNRDPKNWKGFKFAIPFEYSMHNFLLRYYLAENGLNPDTDVQLRVTPPAEMVANLRAGNIDGFLGPDPFNQRAVFDEVGFIHVLSKDLWNGHPCCAFGTSDRLHPEEPQHLCRAVPRRADRRRHGAQAQEPRADCQGDCAAQYLNQPEAVINQVLTGKFADGLGNMKNVPDRADFDPMPWQSMAVWMLTQMKRWGYVKGDVNYKQIAEKVFLITDAKKHMKDWLARVPDGAYPKFKIMGKEFDPAKADDYVQELCHQQGGVTHAPFFERCKAARAFSVAGVPVWCFSASGLPPPQAAAFGRRVHRHDGRADRVRQDDGQRPRVHQDHGLPHPGPDGRHHGPAAVQPVL